ncbi:uncharacterized protein LOC103574720 [Microplitis demolitor]|uniref:uncharacterized protein LOC103574720 n=1 Tax=Microplitis demolitor TaxID=69319 RepID=UPI0004CD71CF|nr:uncharacterized protein LOC103574720 [Microplitis demolitor]
MSVIIPGVNCIETETSEDESVEENSIPDVDPTEAATVEDETDQGSVYTVDVTRNNIMYSLNDFVRVGAVNTDAPITYYKTMEPGYDLKIYQAKLEVDGTSIYDSKSSGKMTGVCDHSYPEGSVEANIWKIINLSIMNGQECPIPKGENYTVPRDLHSVSLNFDEPIACGDYKLHADFDTPENKWAFATDYMWKIKKDSTDCTDDVK